MNISSTSLTSVSPTTYTAPTAGTSQTASTDPDGDGDRTKTSKLGDLMKKLQDLASADPDKAKAVLSKIATSLRDKAGTTGDTKLTALADKFDQAAQSGDLSVLRPQSTAPGQSAGGHHGGHHHGHHGSSASTATTSGKVDSYEKNGQNPMADVASIISSALAS